MSIRVQGLVKRHAGAAEPVLRGIDFEVAPGQLAAILGSSGAGKSTLLRCLVGLEGFEEGEIAVDGTVVRGGDGSARALALLRGRIGLVFQSFELFPHLRVLENCVLAPMKVRGASRAEAEARARGLLERLGLGDKTCSFPAHLSGGQRQRVAIARALAMEPGVLLYDEPTSALDPSLKQEVVEALRGVKSTGVTQVVVTHDVELARAASEVVFVLDKGKIVERGPPGEVLDAPKEPATRKLLGKD